MYWKFQQELMAFFRHKTAEWEVVKTVFFPLLEQQNISEENRLKCFGSSIFWFYLNVIFDYLGDLERL